MYVCMYVSMYVCMYVYMYVCYVCMYACMYARTTRFDISPMTPYPLYLSSTITTITITTTTNIYSHTYPPLLSVIYVFLFCPPNPNTKISPHYPPYFPSNKHACIPLVKSRYNHPVWVNFGTSPWQPPYNL